MKNKIIKILERPKIVIPFVLIVSVAVGFFVYKNFGISPKVQISNQGNTDSSTSYIISSEFKDGEVVDLAFPKGGRVDKIYVKTGDKVKKGQLLANLDSTDVKGALEIAKANYTRIINGATGPDIDVAKAAVATAQTALDQIKIQQDLLVKNAYKNLLGTGLAAVSEDASSIETPPVISGTYSKEQEGKIILNIFH